MGLFFPLKYIKKSQHCEFSLGVQFPFHCPGLDKKVLQFLVVFFGCWTAFLNPFLFCVPVLDGNRDGGLNSLSFWIREGLLVVEGGGLAKCHQTVVTVVWCVVVYVGGVAVGRFKMVAFQSRGHSFLFPYRYE